MLLQEAIRDYFSDFKIFLATIVLLIVSLILSFVPNSFFSSGQIFLEKGTFSLVGNFFYLEIILFLIYVVFFSITVMFVILVQKHGILGKVPTQTEIDNYKFVAFRIIIWNIILAMVLFLINFFTPVSFYKLFSLISFLILFLTLYMSQSLVLDEHPILFSLRESFLFIRFNFLRTLEIVATMLVLFFILVLVEFAIDSFVPIGNYLTIIVTTVFLLPIFELMKTRLYAKKVSLLHHYMKLGRR